MLAVPVQAEKEKKKKGLYYLVGLVGASMSLARRCVYMRVCSDRGDS